MPPWLRAAETLLIIAFQQDDLAVGISAVPEHGKSTEHVMRERPLCHVEDKEVRRPRKIWMQRDSDKAAFPVIIHARGQIKGWRRQQASVFPDAQRSGLVGDENPSVRSYGESGG